MAGRSFEHLKDGPMQILVTETRRGSPDGIETALYRAAHIYGPDTEPQMPGHLAAVFIQQGWGQEVDSAVRHAKALGGPPENKHAVALAETEARRAAGGTC